MQQNRKYLQCIKQLNKSACINDGIKIKFATTSSEFSQAMQLIHKIYTQKGLITSDGKQTYFSPHIILPNNRLVVAIKNNTVIGTISLIEDSPIGVPMDNVHPYETAALRSQKEKFAEVGSFAIESEYQHHGITLLLYKAVFLYICLHRNIQSILIAVHPRVSDFYRSLFKFEKIGDEQKYSTLNNAKSVPLKARSADAIAFINNNDMFNSENRNICFDYILTQYVSPNATLDINGINNAINYIPIWCESHIQRYFDECQVTVSKLPEKQRTIISWLYPTIS